MLKMRCTVWPTLALLHAFVGLSSATTFVKAKANFEDLIDAYTNDNGVFFTRTVPKSNQLTALNVQLTLHLYAINGYNEVSGILDVAGSLEMNWIDSIVSVSSSTITNSDIITVMIDYRKIWTPPIVLVNDALSVLQLGDISYKARFNYSSGEVSWNPRFIVGASCSPDVTFYPFDQQTCLLTFTTWYHDSTMVTLSLVSTSGWDLSEFDTNAVWAIKTTSGRVYTANSQSYAEFTIVMKRNPQYYAFSIVLPVLLLAVLSGFVFLLPVGSGERVGFCITCFLSFIVLMQTIMQFLPESSSPMSLLCVYVVIMMTFSGSLTIVTVLLMRIHLHPETEQIPKFLIHIVEIVNCKKAKKLIKRVRGGGSKVSSAGDGDENKDKVENGGTGSKAGKEEGKTTGNDDVSQKSKFGTDVTWKSIGDLLDFFFLLFFLGAQGAFTFLFLLPLGVRYA